eukprot:2437313-Alexandrium_andersonii.AAC.1
MQQGGDTADPWWTPRRGASGPCHDMPRLATTPQIATTPPTSFHGSDQTQLQTETRTKLQSREALMARAHT